MPVSFFNIDVPVKLKKKASIRSWIIQTINEHSKITGSINIILTTDLYLQKLNQDHLQKDYFTDIITFNFNENNSISGDLYISIERIEENANFFGVSISQELLRVIIHGILHLLGYDDQTDELSHEIRDAENKFLSLLTIADIV